MAERFYLKGYTVLTSVSHHLLGELKKRIDALERFKGSSRVFVGAGAAIADLPTPEKTILIAGCTRQALFDDDLPVEDRTYRKIFGNRVMMEVQGYVRKIPSPQVSFRKKETSVEEINDLYDRAINIFLGLGISLSGEEEQSLRGYFG
jgi:hypothetical protein